MQANLHKILFLADKQQRQTNRLKITHFQGSNPRCFQKEREFIQLIECYHLFLTYLTSPKGVSLDFPDGS